MQTCILLDKFQQHMARPLPHLHPVKKKVLDPKKERSKTTETTWDGACALQADSETRAPALLPCSLGGQLLPPQVLARLCPSVSLSATVRGRSPPQRAPG